MNFDFLKNLRGLGYIYENCNNAEKLAISLPVQSVFTSRKSAELLAKFIYMAAHNQEMSDLTFSDILSDTTVRRFLNSRDIMDAFHYIRKSGNKAVHGDEEESSEVALAVLQDLHYVAGETACILGLIDDYPMFDEEIASFSDVSFANEEDIDKKAREMFLSYVEEFNAQQERDNYIEMTDYDWFSYSIEGNVEMHEFLEFRYKPKQAELITYLQDYLSTLVRLSVQRSSEKYAELGLCYPVTLNAKLIIGNAVYSSDNIEPFMDAIVNELPNANGFVIDCYCNGVLREFFEDEANGNFAMIKKDAVWTGAGMLDKLLEYKRRNMFEYKLSVFYPDSGEFKFEKIHNGKEVDVFSSFSEGIINDFFDEEWWSWSLTLWADFDNEKYSAELDKLHNIVRENVPQDAVCNCEEAWNEGETGTLCNDIQWGCNSLRDVQDFLDKINSVLLPIAEDVDAGCDGIWEIKSKFAVAKWKWTEEGFKMFGTCF